MKMLRFIFLFSLILFFPMQARRVFPGEMLWNMAQLTTEASYDIAISQDNMPLTITNSGTYTFAQSLTGDIIIAADNVVVNLNGHELTGNISSTGFTNVIVFNGKITQLSEDNCMDMDNMVNAQIEDIDFSNGIIGLSAISTGTNILVNNCTFTSQTTQGILMDSVQSPQITNCTFNRITSSGGSTVGVLSFTNCQDVYCENLDIAGNQLTGTSGIVFNSTNAVEIVNCRIKNNTGSSFQGILISTINIVSPLAYTFENCLIQNNTATGSFFALAGGNTISSVVKNCIISDNISASDFFGIFFASLSEDGVIENNNVLNNSSTAGTFFGIEIANSVRFSVRNNIVKDNTGNASSRGIVELGGASADNTIFNNEVRNNSGTGIVKLSSDTYALGNISSKNAVANYSGVPVGTVNIVTYDISAGTYNVTPVATSNIDAVP